MSVEIKYLIIEFSNQMAKKCILIDIVQVNFALL